MVVSDANFLDFRGIQSLNDEVWLVLLHCIHSLPGLPPWRVFLVGTFLGAFHYDLEINPCRLRQIWGKLPVHVSFVHRLHGRARTRDCSELGIHEIYERTETNIRNTYSGIWPFSHSIFVPFSSPRRLNHPHHPRTTREEGQESSRAWNPREGWDTSYMYLRTLGSNVTQLK